MITFVCANLVLTLKTLEMIFPVCEQNETDIIGVVLSNEMPASSVCTTEGPVHTCDSLNVFLLLRLFCDKFSNWAQHPIHRKTKTAG